MAALPEKRVAAIQSCYVPWRGYFDFIASVDLFVIYDDVQYSSGTYRNRNQLKTEQGLKWITVPVSYNFGDCIDQVMIAASKKPWRDAHEALLKSALAPCPFAADAINLWKEGVKDQDASLSNLNERLLRIVCKYLGINTEFCRSRDFELTSSKTERLIQLLKKTNATRYLSGPAAKDYIEEKFFRENNISLEYKSYSYPEYQQAWGAFAPTVSILDVIANLGPDAAKHIRATAPDTVAVPRSAQ